MLNAQRLPGCALASCLSSRNACFSHIFRDLDREGHFMLDTIRSMPDIVYVRHICVTTRRQSAVLPTGRPVSGWPGRNFSYPYNGRVPVSRHGHSVDWSASQPTGHSCCLESIRLNGFCQLSDSLPVSRRCQSVDWPTSCPTPKFWV